MFAAGIAGSNNISSTGIGGNVGPHEVMPRSHRVSHVERNMAHTIFVGSGQGTIQVESCSSYCDSLLRYW